jgi:hypothetical protein
MVAARTDRARQSVTIDLAEGRHELRIAIEPSRPQPRKPLAAGGRAR